MMTVWIWCRRRAVRSHWPALLCLINIGFIVLLACLVPSWVNIFQRSRSGEAGTITGVETTTGTTFTKGTKENYRSRSTSTSEQPDFHPSSSSDCWGDRCYYYATGLKRDALESLITDIQKTVQAEKEKILKLENQVRMLDLWERYLKEMVGGIRREGNWEMIGLQVEKLMERMEMVEHRLSIFMASFMTHKISSNPSY